MEKLSYVDIAKALIQDAQKGNFTHFDFSNMEKLAEQLSDIFVLRRGVVNKPTLKSVAEYVKKL